MFYLETECRQLEHELNGKHDGEYNVSNIQHIGVHFSLSVELWRRVGAVLYNNWVTML